MRGWGFLFAAVPAILAAAPVSSAGPPDERPGQLAPMPEAISNNAVAALQVEGRSMLFSFSGLRTGKTRKDITSSAYSYDLKADRWTRLPDVPGGKHRLASVAVGLDDLVYIFGGYSVAADGTEVSTPEVYAFNPLDNSYKPRAPMPVPVDDAVAFAYADRYIYLVSGWHDTGNVADVQVLDTREDKWFAASPYPGSPVFGHAGGIVGNRMVVADGVKVAGTVDGRRRFAISDEAYMGIIDPGDPALIRWQALSPHPGAPLYRMAATGSERLGLVLFVGGSDNPYNYNGMGYNGVPSEPSARIHMFEPRLGSWSSADFPVATMDHRGLPEIGDAFYVIGGMRAGQQVSATVEKVTLEIED